MLGMYHSIDEDVASAFVLRVMDGEAFATPVTKRRIWQMVTFTTIRLVHLFLAFFSMRHDVWL